MTEPCEGLNRARNTGIAAARAKLIAFCDADDEVSPGWLRAMLGGFEHFDVIGGSLELDHLNGQSPMKTMCKQTHALPTCLGFHYAIGANFGFTRGVFDAVDGFDEHFTYGHDEIDFCIRSQLAGFSIGFVRDATIHYRIRRRARDVARQYRRYGIGYELLVSKLQSLGAIDRPLSARWRAVAYDTKELLKSSQGIVERRTRLPLLASASYLAGRFGRLASETASRASHR